MTPEQEIVRANHAQDALNNPLISEALSHYEKELTEAWKTSPLRDVEGRERLRLMLAAHQAFASYLQTTIETGKLAKVQTSNGPMTRLASFLGAT